MKRKFFIILLAAVILISVAGCGTKNGPNDADDGGKSAIERVHTYRKSGKNPIVTMVVKDFGTIKIELYPLKAPNTVNNFIYLINQKFYDGLTFHRVIKDFMIQGGDPDADGTGGPGYTIKGEFGINGFNYNDIKHERGVISMARVDYDLDSAGSQFFIMHKAAHHLDLEFAAFGKVIEGMEVVDAIAEIETGGIYGATPVEDVIIEKVTVETFGDEYPEPEKIKD